MLQLPLVKPIIPATKTTSNGGNMVINDQVFVTNINSSLFLWTTSLYLFLYKQFVPILKSEDRMLWKQNISIGINKHLFISTLL